MSFQDIIHNKLAPFKRKVHDIKIGVSGFSYRIIVINFTKDKFGDMEEVSVVKNFDTELNITNLEDIPISRFRRDLRQPLVQSQQSLFLFDVLPFEVSCKFTDDIEIGDYLIHKVYRQAFDEKPYYLVFRITEEIGTFDNSLLKRYFHAAPYTQELDDDVVTIIEGYK